MITDREDELEDVLVWIRKHFTTNGMKGYLLKTVIGQILQGDHVKLVLEEAEKQLEELER